MKPLTMMIITAACLSMPGVVFSQEEAPAAAKPRPCSSVEARQFDFWIGEWTVTANGKEAGTNRITSILGGCVLLEEYESPGGYAGKSFNFYDESTGKWHQTWVDNSGLRLRLTGEFADGRMVLSGTSQRTGKTVIDRITWHNNPDGTVRQVWDVSGDGGATWNTVFDGLYTRKD
jgi:hypothetical protein